MSYYTPTIEEFHIGFEYEVLNKVRPVTVNPDSLVEIEFKNTWHKFTYPDPYLGFNLKRMFESYTIRVKCLDEDDILLLGFKNISLPVSIGKHFIRDEVRIMFTEDLVIAKGLNFVFRGKVKNKSELVVLLKQIGI